jgi:hypothetical protein
MLWKLHRNDRYLHTYLFIFCIEKSVSSSGFFSFCFTIKDIEDAAENIVTFCKLVNIGLLPFDNKIGQAQLNAVKNALSNFSVKDCSKVNLNDQIIFRFDYDLVLFNIKKKLFLASNLKELCVQTNSYHEILKLKLILIN